MIRNDGSEVSLARLEQLYGKPRDITTRTKTPKPVAKPVGFERRLVDSSFDQLRKDGKALMDELDILKLKNLKEELRVAAINTSTNIRPELQDGLIAKFEKAKNTYTEYNFNFSRNLEKLRNKMLETSLQTYRLISL